MFNEVVDVGNQFTNFSTHRNKYPALFIKELATSNSLRPLLEYFCALEGRRLNFSPTTEFEIPFELVFDQKEKKYKFEISQKAIFSVWRKL